MPRAFTAMHPTHTPTRFRVQRPSCFSTKAWDSSNWRVVPASTLVMAALAVTPAMTIPTAARWDHDPAAPYTT
jgi:hypothetical protein